MLRCITMCLYVQVFHTRIYSISPPPPFSLLLYPPPNKCFPLNMLVHLRDGSAWTIVYAATWKTQVADQACYLTQSLYTDTRPTSLSTDPVIPGTWQASHWSTLFSVPGRTPPGHAPRGKLGLNPGVLLSRWTSNLKANQMLNESCQRCQLVLLLCSQLYLWGSPFGVRFLHMWLFFNPTTEVVTFRLLGFCMLGVFDAGIHSSGTWMSGSFESVRRNACVHRLDLSLYSHLKEFWGNGVRTHVNSKGKILLTVSNPASAAHYQWAIPTPCCPWGRHLASRPTRQSMKDVKGANNYHRHELSKLAWKNGKYALCSRYCKASLQDGWQLDKHAIIHEWMLHMTIKSKPLWSQKDWSLTNIINLISFYHHAPKPLIEVKNIYIYKYI